MKGKTYRVEHNCICTEGNILIEGGEYLYREGSHNKRIFLEKVIEQGEWLKLRVLFPDDNRRKEISHKNDDSGYMGMWRLYDWTEESKAEIEEADSMREELMKDFPPAPRHTRADFFKGLTEDQRANILIHFNGIYECSELSEKDYDMVWLAWIIGEKLLDVSGDFIMHEMGEVEFNFEEYEKTFEGDIPAGTKIDLLRESYDLDRLYEEVLRK
jgi:hypothetical protein